MIATSCSRPGRCLWRPDGGRRDEGCRCSGWSIVSTADLVAVFAALATTVLMGFAGVAIDVGYWQMAQRNMQGAADRAAYSAVIAAGAGGLPVRLPRPKALLHRYQRHTHRLQ